MKLKKLIQILPNVEVRGSKEVDITGITSDSRTIAPGHLFVARKGLSEDGAHYIPDAIAAGATAIATDLYDPSLKIPQVIAQDLRSLEGDLATFLYNYPAKELLTVGVTGTNGKTSTTYLIRHMLEVAGTPCGLIGSVEYLLGHHSRRATHTTPDAPLMQKLLREMVRFGCKAAAIEVSSHGLDQGRVRHINFDLAIFTNLTQDHLDYHKTMDQYAQAKAKLFTQAKKAIINIDDPYADQMKHPETFTYGFGKADLRATDVTLTSKGSSFKLNGVDFQIPLVGRFQVSNCMAATAAGLLQGLTLQEISNAMRTAPPIPGRLERVTDRPVFVDFAHTPDALRQVLLTLRELNPRKLILLFGCGGDRDRAKRPIMGKIANELADTVILTNDNPRSEDPVQILNEIGPGTHILDRKEAIAHALSLTTNEDILLIAGKGHETYQILAHRRVAFDDREVVRNLCES